MAKLVTIYESYIERPRPAEMHLSASAHTFNGMRARRVAEEHLQHRVEPAYEHWSTEALCAQGRMLGIDIDSMGTRDRLIIAIRRATRKGGLRRH